MKQIIVIVGLFVFSLVPTGSHANDEVIARVEVVTSTGVVQIDVGGDTVTFFGTKIDGQHLTQIVKDRNKKMKDKPEVSSDHRGTRHEFKVMHAAVLLGKVKEPTAFPHLLALLDDPYFSMRGHAAYSLEKFGARNALPTLLRVLQEGKPCNGNLVPAIAVLGDNTAVLPLINTIHSGGSNDAAKRLKAIETITGLSLKEMREEWGLVYYGDKLPKFHRAMHEWWGENKHKSRNGKTAEPATTADGEDAAAE